MIFPTCEIIDLIYTGKETNNNEIMNSKYILRLKRTKIGENFHDAKTIIIFVKVSIGCCAIIFHYHRILQ